MSGRFGRAFPPAVICCCARCCIPGFPATRWRCNPRGHRCLRRTAQRFAVRWRKKNVEVHLFCGTQDSDCIEMAQMLYGALHSAGGRVHLTLQTGLRHRFPPQMGREYLRLVTRP